MMIYLSVRSGKLHGVAGATKFKARFSCVSKKGLVQHVKRLLKKCGETVDDLMVMCSSSLDFPQEYTKNKKVIALCRELRS